MSKEDVFVGIKNPSVITRVITHFNNSVGDFETKFNDVLETRQKFDLAKVEFLDALMDFVQEYAVLKQQVPVIKFKTLDYKKVKSRLKEKVQKKRVELEEKKAKDVVKELKQEVKVKPSEDLVRLKNFRRELENLNRQITNLI